MWDIEPGVVVVHLSSVLFQRENVQRYNGGHNNNVATNAIVEFFKS